MVNRVKTGMLLLLIVKYVDAYVYGLYKLYGDVLTMQINVITRGWRLNELS